MWGILLLILGVVGLAVPQQFGGQDVIATVLLIIGAILLAIQIVWFLFVANKVRKTHKEVRNRFRSRGFDV